MAVFGNDAQQELLEGIRYIREKYDLSGIQILQAIIKVMDYLLTYMEEK